MHCYQTLAATMLAANMLEKLPHAQRKMPPAEVADWLEFYGIGVDEILEADRHTLQAQLAALADREARERLPSAA